MIIVVVSFQLLYFVMSDLDNKTYLVQNNTNRTLPGSGLLNKDLPEDIVIAKFKKSDIL